MSTYKEKIERIEKNAAGKFDPSFHSYFDSFCRNLNEAEDKLSKVTTILFDMDDEYQEYLNQLQERFKIEVHYAWEEWQKFFETQVDFSETTEEYLASLTTIKDQLKELSPAHIEHSYSDEQLDEKEKWLQNVEHEGFGSQYSKLWDKALNERPAKCYSHSNPLRSKMVTFDNALDQLAFSLQLIQGELMMIVVYVHDALEDAKEKVKGEGK